MARVVSLTSSRLALADAEELHRKIERLRARSSALEDALRSLQAAVCDEPHPLLSEDAQMSSESSPHSASDGPLLTREDEAFLDSFGIYLSPIMTVLLNIHAYPQVL